MCTRALIQRTVGVISVNGVLEECASDQENVSLQFTGAPVVLACPDPAFMIIISLIVCVCICVCVSSSFRNIFISFAMK